MTRQELEEAIDNGDSVWCVYKDQSDIYEIKAVEIEKVLSNVFLWGNEYYSYIKDAFKTKAEAQHYLNHANVERVEKLPFLTWEEFKSGKNITFKAKNGHEFLLKAKQESIYLWWLETNNIWASWDLTEENFYKAYDECVRLFRREE